MKRFILIGLLLTAPVLASCANNPPPTPVATVADVASKIEDTAHEILTTAKTYHDSAVLNPINSTLLVSTATLDTVALAVNKVGHVGLNLKTALDAYNVAKIAGMDLTAQRLAVQKLMQAVTDAMADVGKAIPNGTIQQIDTLVVQVLGLVAQVKTGVGL